MSKTNTKKPKAPKLSIRDSLGLKKSNRAPFLEKVGAKLTINQELFCQLITNPGELFGNATQAYAEAYHYDLDSLSTEDAVWLDEERDPDTKEVIQKKEKVQDSSYDRGLSVCSTNGSRLLRNAKVAQRVSELMQEKVLNHKTVDARMARWIMDDREPATSARMIELYNKLEGRLKDEPAKVEVYLGLDDIIAKAREAYERIHGPAPA